MSKHVALAWRRFAGGPTEVLAPSNRTTAALHRQADDRDDLAEMRRLGAQRTQMRAQYERGEMTHVQWTECNAAMTALLWVIAEGK